MALAVIDGVIDSPRARSQLADKPDAFFLEPDAVAETVYWLTQQKKSAWTFELEVRPFAETGELTSPSRFLFGNGEGLQAGRQWLLYPRNWASRHNVRERASRGHSGHLPGMAGVPKATYFNNRFSIIGYAIGQIERAQRSKKIRSVAARLPSENYMLGVFTRAALPCRRIVNGLRRRTLCSTPPTGGRHRPQLKAERD